MQSHQRSLPKPNVAAACGLGPAYVEADVLSVLDALGLIANGYWAEASETILWRIQPKEWKLDVMTDQRFANAIAQACATLPDDIRQDIEKP